MALADAGKLMEAAAETVLAVQEDPRASCHFNGALLLLVPLSPPAPPRFPPGVARAAKASRTIEAAWAADAVVLEAAEEEAAIHESRSSATRRVYASVTRLREPGATSGCSRSHQSLVGRKGQMSRCSASAATILGLSMPTSRSCNQSMRASSSRNCCLCDGGGMVASGSDGGNTAT